VTASHQWGANSSEESLLAVAPNHSERAALASKDSSLAWRRAELAAGAAQSDKWVSRRAERLRPLRRPESTPTILGHTGAAAHPRRASRQARGGREAGMHTVDRSPKGLQHGAQSGPGAGERG